MKQTKLTKSDIIWTVFAILVYTSGAVFVVLFLYGMVSEKIDMKKCYSEGLDLIYPYIPLEGIRWEKPHICGNVTELNKTYVMEQAPVSKWWYWENERTN